MVDVITDTPPLYTAGALTEEVPYKFAPWIFPALVTFPVNVEAPVTPNVPFKLTFPFNVDVPVTFKLPAVVTFPVTPKLESKLTAPVNVDVPSTTKFSSIDIQEVYRLMKI